MTREEFWQIVEQVNQESSNDEEKTRKLHQTLSLLTPKKIIAFDIILDELLAESYNNDLWAAAYIINNGCDEADFYIFRSWLIGQGKKVFEDALRNPATLESSIIMDADWYAELEDFLCIPQEVYEEITGSKMPKRPTLEWILTGNNWKNKDVDKLFPSLTKKAESRWKSKK